MADAIVNPCSQLSKPTTGRAGVSSPALFCCALAIALAGSVPAQAVSPAIAGHPAAQTQQPADGTAAQRSIEILDAKNHPVAGATVRDAAGKLLGTADAAGRVTLACSGPCAGPVAPVSLVVEAAGFAPRKAIWTSAGPAVLQIVLQVAAAPDSVSVTAYRAPLGELESPSSTRVLSTLDLRQAAPLTLDGQLRLIPGVETFRRSSSLVANPSSQGLSLRGLGSTSASRTLVTQDDVPLNDAFGGWIHWEELPELSIRSVEVVRGGASDLYGSSAIGGVVNVIPQRPGSDFAELKSEYGSENTYQDSLLLEGYRNRWGALASGGVLGTDGFVTLTPAARGLIDTPSNVHAQNGMALFDRQQGTVRLFLRGSGLNEARNNGTILQENETRLWRFATGSDWNPASGWANGSTLVFRAYGSSEHYRQTFSTTCSAVDCPTKATAPQNFEWLNRSAQTPDDEMGLVLHWSKPLTPGLLVVAGADSHDVRAGDYETTFVQSGAVVSHINLGDRQRQTGVYAELLYLRKAWTVSGSGRVDWFSNFDGNRLMPTQQALPRIGQRVFDPRLGVSRKIGSHFAISGSGFRAFRAPTPNELYRSTQVGSLLTLPNNDLLSERATGWEAGGAMEQRWGTLRASYFWTQVNDPITALTIDGQSSPIKLMRENLGQIESRGVSADLEFRPTRWMTLQTGYQHANATVTRGTGDAPAGNWIPQVAHNMATAQLRGYTPKLGTLSLQGRLSGHQFDDDANLYNLHGYFKLDAYAAHDFGKRIEFFTSGENLLNRAIEVGRTPTLTLGTPRVARVGFNIKLTPGVK